MKQPKTYGRLARISMATLLVIALALSIFIIFSLQFQKSTPGGPVPCRDAPLWESWMLCFIYEIELDSYNMISSKCKDYFTSENSTLSVAQLDYKNSITVMSGQYQWFRSFNLTSENRSSAANVFTRLAVIYDDGGILMRSDMDCEIIAKTYVGHPNKTIIMGDQGSFVIAPPESPFIAHLMLPFVDEKNFEVLDMFTPDEIISEIIPSTFELYPCKSQVTIVDETSGNATNQAYMRVRFHHFAFKKVFGTYLHSVLMVLMFLANVLVFTFVIRTVMAESAEISVPELHEVDLAKPREGDV